MAFQILDKDNNPISIAQLDAEAAAFWGKEVHPRYYVSPPQKGESEFIIMTRELTSNWFDTIGYNIHYNTSTYHKNYQGMTWKMVKESMMLFITDVLSTEPNLLINNQKYWKDHFALIDHWESKGYQPRQVKD
jgi:hypothetical protein